MKIATASWILLGIVWLGLYWPLLTGHVPAFRDAFHFYYPLEHWLDQQARQGELFPTFNPFDATGANLAGEMSTGLFYPGRILWWLPALSVAQRLGVVLLAHTCIAGVGAAYAARRMQLGAAAQVLAAASYSLSGPVFFQHVNPIFLISAAWLPWVVAECFLLAAGCDRVDELAGQSHEKAMGWRWLVGVSGLVVRTQPSTSVPQKIALRTRWWVWIVACSLMMLGGDPQGTLHCGLISLLAVITGAWRSGSSRYLCSALLQLSLAVIAVTGLTAIQSLPTWYWYQAAIVDVNSWTSTDQVPAWLQAIAPPAHDVGRGSAYAYSVAPWHLLTLIYSNVFGHFMPENSRYLAAWSAEPRVWTVSLSVGAMSLLLAVSCLCMRSTRARSGYLWCVALLASTAMLGNYAPVWMFKQLLRWLGIESSWLPGDEVGGTYWLLQCIVPGYDAFRYPAKWSPVLAISLTLCAAQALDRWPDAQRFFSRSLKVFAIATALVTISCIAAFNVATTRELFMRWTDGAAPDGWLGAIDGYAAMRTLLISLLLACLLCVLTIVALQRAASALRPWCLVYLVIFELGISAHAWLVTIPESHISCSLPAKEPGSWTRVWAGVGQANLARDLAPEPELKEKLQYQQQFALAKLHLLASDTGNLSAFMTLPPRALARVRYQLAQLDTLEPVNPRLDEALAWLGVQQRLVRDNELHWQEIPDPAPLIEADDTHTLHVKYLSPARIKLNVACQREGKIVVRLLQDAGWEAHLRGNDGSSRVVRPSASHLGLFQTLDIPPGQWDIELEYRAPGLLAGAWISAAAVVILAGYLTKKLRDKKFYLRSTNTTCEGLPTGTY